jgi:hypothetical protein
MTITSEILEQFKERMRLTDREDGNLLRMLQASELDLQQKIGKLDASEHERFKELVFERSRYVYNDSLEYFEDNFQSILNSLAIEVAMEEGVDDGETGI